MGVLHSPFLCQDSSASLGLFSPIWHHCEVLPSLREGVTLLRFPIPEQIEWVRSCLPLSPKEKQRGAALLRPQSRCQFLWARSVLRICLGHYLACPPEKVPLREGKWGKPYVEGASLYFNMAHSRRWGLLALSPQREVGADVEFMKPDRDWERLVKKYFSPVEQREFFSLPVEQRFLAFYLGWTRKEAYIKYWGKGLSLGLSRFSVSLSPHLSTVYQFHTSSSPSLSLSSFFLAPSFLACLATSVQPLSLQFFQIDPLLFLKRRDP